MDGTGVQRLMSRLAALRDSKLGVSLSRVQALVGLTTGILSIGGAAVAYFTPPPQRGQVVAVIQEARSQKAITDATVEVLTQQNAVLATATPNFLGKARVTLEEGGYRIRVSHPRYGSQTRPVQVVEGQTTEVRVELRPGVVAPLRHAERFIEEGATAVRRLFGQ
jgi:hypothetical protein